MLGTKGDDGVFRYEPPKDDPADADKPRPGDIDDDVADWFEGTSAAEVAAAVRQVEREAMVTIEQQDAARTAAYRNPGGELPAAPERPAVPPAPGGQGRPQGQQPPPQQGGYPTQGYPGRDAPTGPPPPGYPPYQPPDPGQYRPGQR
jgi:hypothetical protein